VDSFTAGAPFIEILTKNNIVKIIFTVVFIYPYFAWFLVFILALTVAVCRNTILTTIIASFYKDRAYETHILAIESERKKQEFKIKKLKEIESLNETTKTDVDAATDNNDNK
jgi:hypothetical protein